MGEDGNVVAEELHIVLDVRHLHATERRPDTKKNKKSLDAMRGGESDELREEEVLCRGGGCISLIAAHLPTSYSFLSDSAATAESSSSAMTPVVRVRCLETPLRACS